MEHMLVLGLIVGALVLFALEVTRPDIVALGLALVLLLTGTVSVADGFSGFANPAVITVIAMFILSAGLVRTGVADAVGRGVLKVSGSSPTLLTLVVMVCVGALSAFMNNIGAVAVLLPATIAVAQAVDYPATKLLIPLSFGSLLGGLATLIGTPPNLLMSIALEDHGWEPFQLFDFAPTGIAVTIAGTLYMAFVGRHLLPSIRPQGDLTRRFEMEGYLTELVVPDGSSFAGRTLAENDVHARLGLTVLRLQRLAGDEVVIFTPSGDTILEVGDRLVAEGSVDVLLEESSRPLDIYAETKLADAELTNEMTRLGEAAIAPGSRLVGTTIQRGWLRSRYGVLVLALRRRGDTQRERFTTVPLEVGDVLLVQGPEDSLADMAASRDFLMVNRVEPKRRDRSKAPWALLAMAVTIGAAAFGLLHISVAGMLGVLLMIITGVMRPEDMYRDVEWRVIFLIAFMMPLGIAMDDDHVGTARWLADHIVAVAGDHGPLILLGALILFATTVTEVMSNAAAAVLMAPIAIAVAVSMGYEPYPFVMALAIAISSTFLTPIGHQANVLVYGVGNYRFIDFTKVGAPLNLLSLIVTLIVVPIVWPFTPIAG